MMDLSLVGLSEDGAMLVLSTEDGRRFTLAIDERLRSAVRGGRTPESEDAPRTYGAKEIQAAMRSGATAEEASEVSGWSVDRVNAFATPVLMERQWIAEKARACPVGRGEDALSLGDLVTRRLGERGIEESTIRWDAWLREDGDWTVLLAYPAGQGDRVATWSFKPAAHGLTALDDEARWFTEDRVPEESRPRLVQMPGSEPAAAPDPERTPSRNHPAGRAQQRSDGSPGSSPARTTGAGPDSGSKTAAPEQSEPARKKDDSPTWDEVLFGAPMDEPER